MAVTADQQKAAKVPMWQGVIAYFSNALHAVAAISKMGCVKHNNGKMPTKWRDYPVETYADAEMRHITEQGKGILYDSESHMLHAGHEAWNVLAKLEKLLEVHPLIDPQFTLEQKFGPVIPSEPQGKCVTERRVVANRRIYHNRWLARENGYRRQAERRSLEGKA